MMLYILIKNYLIGNSWQAKRQIRAENCLLLPKIKEIRLAVKTNSSFLTY